MNVQISKNRTISGMYKNVIMVPYLVETTFSKYGRNGSYFYRICSTLKFIEWSTRNIF